MKVESDIDTNIELTEVADSKDKQTFHSKFTQHYIFHWKHHNSSQAVALYSFEWRKFDKSRVRASLVFWFWFFSPDKYHFGFYISRRNFNLAHFKQETHSNQPQRVLESKPVYNAIPALSLSPNWVQLGGNVGNKLAEYKEKNWIVPPTLTSPLSPPLSGCLYKEAIKGMKVRDHHK